MKEVSWLKFDNDCAKFGTVEEFLLEWHWAGEKDETVFIKFEEELEELEHKIRKYPTNISETQYADGWSHSKEVIEISGSEIYFYCMESAYHSWADPDTPNFYPLEIEIFRWGNKPDDTEWGLLFFDEKKTLVAVSLNHE